MKLDFAKLKNRDTSFCDIEIYREHSVLVPMVKTGESYSLLFEIRAEKLNKQPNEICFPGGKIEKKESKQEAAIRETAEELLLPVSNIEIWGELDTVVTPFNTIIYPFAGQLNKYTGTYNADEVKDVFLVPLSFFIETNPLCHNIDIRMVPKEDFPYNMIQKGRNYPWGRGRYPVYFYTYDNKIIWGITARIIKNFIQIVKSNKQIIV
ncbi:MAG: NUDIX hydrolase [Caulobacteraceae bacterium]